MRKVRGCLELASRVQDQDAYDRMYADNLQEIVEWAQRRTIELSIGCSDDKAYLCEYVISGNTKEYCLSMSKELRAELKKSWRKLVLRYEILF